MRLKTLLASLALIAYLALPAFASAVGLEVAIGTWRQNPSGDMMYKGDALDLENDLGIKDEGQITGRLKLDMPSLIPNIYLMATPMEFEGKSTKSFKFADRTFTTATESKIELTHYDLALYYGIPALEELSDDRINIDLGLNGRLMEINAEVRQSLPAIEEKKSLTVAIPMLFVALQIRPSEHFAMEFEGRGISYSGNSIFDAIARIKFIPLEVLFFTAGYRYERYKIDVSDVEADMSFQGPIFEAGLEF